MTDRIARTFSALAKEKRPGLITFIMGGDPDAETSLAVLNALPEAGADIIEIGMPFSDPMADGPVIQAAGLRALENGTTLKSVLAQVTQFRVSHKDTPIVLMGYFNPLFRYELKKFCADAHTAGADGLIIVDLPPEEEEELKREASAQSIHLIRLVAPTSKDARLVTLLKSSSGFVYYISVAGITGAKAAEADVLQAQLANLKALTDLPVAVGFGIKTPEQAKTASQGADAVVVGSALVDLIAKTEGNKAAGAAQFVRSLAAALR